MKHEDIANVSLNAGTIHRSFASHSIGEWDENANVFGVRCYKNGQPEDLSGAACIGYFIRADRTTVVIPGSVSGNVAAVTLPESCYAVEGNFSLAIKVNRNGVVETMRIVDGTVVNTSDGAYVDPGSVVPDLEELMAVIGDAEAAADRIETFSVYAQLISGNNYKIVVEEGS